MKLLTAEDKLSIIIIVRNRQSHLENALKSIESNSPYFSEVIVVHMNQPVQTGLYDLVNYDLSQYTIYSNTESLPLAKARNLGASKAKSNTLFFLDVDCIVDENTCLEYLKACKENTEEIYMSKCFYLEEPVKDLNDLKSIEYSEHPKRTVNTYPRWQLFWSLSFVINKDWFNKLGCFDEDFINYGGEDTELSYRNHLKGSKLNWVKEAVVYHQPHEINELPIHHIKSVVANINYFYDKYGFYIMENWIDGFEKLNLVKKVNNKYIIL